VVAHNACSVLGNTLYVIHAIYKGVYTEQIT